MRNDSPLARLQEKTVKRLLLGYCAYNSLAHSRLVKVPPNWFYGK